MGAQGAGTSLGEDPCGSLAPQELPGAPPGCHTWGHGMVWAGRDSTSQSHPQGRDSFHQARLLQDNLRWESEYVGVFSL